jgi:membrane protease YdiL (CAAX protease family)
MPAPPKPWLPLLLLVPASSLGILAALYLAPGPVGQGLFALSKLWLIAFPLAWTFLVEGDRSIRFLFRCPGYGPATVSGLLMGGIIVAAGITIGPAWIDLEVMRSRLAEAGLGRPPVYLAGAVYWCLANALMEEYVWRWFVYRHCLRLAGAHRAIWLSGLLFTLHHVLALAAFTGWRVTLLASGGVFIGGMVWATLRHRTGSIWPGYLSHILADAGVFIAGWYLLFS